MQIQKENKNLASSIKKWLQLSSFWIASFFKVQWLCLAHLAFNRLCDFLKLSQSDVSQFFWEKPKRKVLQKWQNNNNSFVKWSLMKWALLMSYFSLRANFAIKICLNKMISLFTSDDIQIQVEINVIQVKKDMNMKRPYWWQLNRLYFNGSVAKIIIKLTTANCSESRKYSKLQNFNSSWTIIN